jgi:translation initiation factor IF-2
VAHPHRETRPGKQRSSRRTAGQTGRNTSFREAGTKLEIVLKADSEGSLEAAAAAISGITAAGVDIDIIRQGLGAVTTSDAFLAETAGRLIIGFGVDVLSGVEKALRERNVEVRLYDVIYALTEDLKVLAEAILPHGPTEQITGSAKVIALFKSSRRGIIAGCEVTEGRLAVGQHFRIVSAMGPVYSGTMESLHIGEHAVQTASPGQRVGIKLRNFSRIKVGDIVESYHPQKKVQGWQPTGRVIRK